MSAKIKASSSIETTLKKNFDEFLASVKYVLVNDRGMPGMLADEMMNEEKRYLQARFEKLGVGDESGIVDAAYGLTGELQDGSGSKWVQIGKDDRVASDGDVVIKLSQELKNHLDNLVSLGLHGDNRNDVAKILFSRGLEAVFPLIANLIK